jgi:hypothetical protein
MSMPYTLYFKPQNINCGFLYTSYLVTLTMMQTQSHVS